MHLKPRAIVSIPERVWGGLEPARYELELVKIVLFQSLRGFGVGWSLMIAPQWAYRSSFQSLRGFGVGWSGRDEV